MKKTIALLTLAIAFSFNAKAQETSSAKTVKTEATGNSKLRNVTKDMEELSNTVTMNESLKRDFTTLLNMQVDAVNGAKTEADKKAIFEVLGKKIISGLDASQLEQLKRNDALFKRLTQY